MIAWDFGNEALYLISKEVRGSFEEPMLPRLAQRLLAAPKYFQSLLTLVSTGSRNYLSTFILDAERQWLRAYAEIQYPQVHQTLGKETKGFNAKIRTFTSTVMI